ncbi:MAG: hypothetical protein HRU39_00615 [Salinicola sp.]|uniref:hypothetical protein n=1 Tax=Salinicola sp. TaxID=1978524 RepID=UPI001D9C7E4E|nr:hypothetical protein [Salinicola sp.]NRB54471.1 hypothetical protein [Salinicola sp.]|tara:strand:- start:162 stop:578 length:417 start_codon:yes stop_codon:yes gene_type:complete
MRRSTLPTTSACLATALLAMAGPAHASSDDAWQEHDRAVIEQCQQASQFPDAAPAGEPVLFDDEAGMTALLIQGHYPQDHMNGQAGQELCLFLRSSQEVYIADADKLAMGSDALPSTPTDAIDDDSDTGRSDTDGDAP